MDDDTSFPLCRLFRNGFRPYFLRDLTGLVQCRRLLGRYEISAELVLRVWVLCCRVISSGLYIKGMTDVLARSSESCACLEISISENASVKSSQR